MRNATSTEKFKELILYVAQKSETDPNFGAIKLNKILFYADFRAFQERGESITGQTYFKLPFGPAPKAMKPVLTQMLAEGLCIEAHRRVHSKVQKRVVAGRDANVEVFDGKEVALV